MRDPAPLGSIFLYSRMLRWYPPELRTEYGEDMLGVFQERLEAARKQASWRGIVKTWFVVGHDLAAIVLPYRLWRAAPGLLAVICAIIFYGSMLAAINPNRHCYK